MSAPALAAVRGGSDGEASATIGEITSAAATAVAPAAGMVQRERSENGIGGPWCEEAVESSCATPPVTTL